MKKLKLKALELGARELLSREQLKNVVGGSYGSDLGSGEEGSGDGGTGTNPKVTACSNKEEGDTCDWVWKGTTYYGKCRAYAPNYVKHCSDLN